MDLKIVIVNNGRKQRMDQDAVSRLLCVDFAFDRRVGFANHQHRSSHVSCDTNLTVVCILLWQNQPGQSCTTCVSFDETMACGVLFWGSDAIHLYQ